MTIKKLLSQEDFYSKNFKMSYLKGNISNFSTSCKKNDLEWLCSPETISLLSILLKYKKTNKKTLNQLGGNIWENTMELHSSKGKGDFSSGVFFKHKPTIKDINSYCDVNSLLDNFSNCKEVRSNGQPIFFSNDGLMSFTPFGYKIGEQSSFELSKNPYIIAKYGEFGAEKIGEISSEFKNKPFLIVEEKFKKEISGIPSIDWRGNFRWLIINGANKNNVLFENIFDNQLEGTYLTYSKKYKSKS